VGCTRPRGDGMDTWHWWLMVVADHDKIVVTDVALALALKRLVMIKGGHFDPYLGAPVDWFRADLASPSLAA
jgi:hypothetical protein